MNRLITTEAAAGLLNTSEGNLYALACNYRKEHGNYPPWYVSNGNKGNKRAYVDMRPIEEFTKLHIFCWLLSTDYLYWWLTEWRRKTPNQVAIELAHRSKKYPSVATWNSFFTNGLFSLQEGHQINERTGRLREFTIYGIAICLAHYRDYYQKKSV